MAWGTAVAGGLTAIGSVLSTSMSNSANGSLNQATRRWQTEENEKSRAFAERMYNIENAYNTPSAQRARYEEAGYNPYLVDSEVGAGVANAPTQTAPNSAPSPIPVQSYQDAFSNLGRLAEVLMKKKAVDAESANQKAQAEHTRIENASRLLQMGYSPSEVVKVMRATNPDYMFNNYEDSRESRTVDALINMHEAKAGYDKILGEIAQKYEPQKQQQIIWNLQQQAAKTVTEMGLMNSLSKVYESQVDLNRSSIRVNEHQIKELDARAYNEIQQGFKAFHEGSYVKKLNLSIEEEKRFYVRLLGARAADEEMGMLEHYADYEENEYIRGWQQSEAGKEAKLVNSYLDFVVGRAERALDLVPTKVAPARAKVKRVDSYSENGMNNRGYKTQRNVTQYEYE